MALIKQLLPAGDMQRVEKASVDEVFLDLSAHVHSVLLARYPDELAGALQAAFACGQPVVVDVAIDREAYTTLLPALRG